MCAESSGNSSPGSAGKPVAGPSDRGSRPRAQVGVVANIRDVTQGGGRRPPVEGHPHFDVGAKVYVHPLEWSYKPGGELRVIGRQKDTGKLACMILRRKFLTGWRVKKVHTPRVLTMIQDAVGPKRWTEKSAASFVEMMKQEDPGFDV